MTTLEKSVDSLKTWTDMMDTSTGGSAGKVRKMYNHKSWLETTNLDLGWIKEYVHQADLDICTLKNCHLFGGCSFCFHWICHWEHTATSACTLLCFQRPHVEAPLDAESNWSWDHEMRSEKFRVTTVKRLLTSAEENKTYNVYTFLLSLHLLSDMIHGPCALVILGCHIHSKGGRHFQCTNDHVKRCTMALLPCLPQAMLRGKYEYQRAP